MQQHRDITFLLNTLCAVESTTGTAKRIVIAGGGTGGHLFPGITVARECLQRNPNSRLLFISTGNAFERSTLEKAGFEIQPIKVAGIKGRGMWKQVQSLTLIPSATCRALSILKAFKPDLVVGVGSYAAGPVVLAAWIKRIKIVLLEQNIMPGITNRSLARFASRIYLSFEDTAGVFDPDKVRLTGNPVRHEILLKSAAVPPVDTATDSDCQRLNILVVGGSQGAHPINEALIDTVKYLSSKGRISIVHQTGSADETRVADAYADLGVDSTVRSFFDDMDQRYQQADLIICRAGATTVAEVTAIGKGLIFIPFPQAADNHQVLNARALEAEGAAEVIEQKDLTPELLANRIDWYAQNRTELDRMAQNAKRFGKPNAVKEIVDDIYELIDGRED